MNRFVKHITTIIFCTIFYTNLTAQFNPVIAYTPATQVIYIGVDNPIAITLGEYNLSDINIKVSEGSIRNASEDGKYLWKICSSKSDSVFLSIYRRDTLLNKLRFYLKELREPIPMVGHGHNCFISEQFWGQVGVRIQNASELYDDLGVKNHLITFKIEFSDTNKVIYKRIINKSAFFTKNSIREFKKLKPLYYIRIYNIKAQVGCEPVPRILSKEIYFRLSN